MGLPSLLFIFIAKIETLLLILDKTISDNSITRSLLSRKLLYGFYLRFIFYNS